ncbi:MAG: glycosyltransferase family 4 protein [Rubritepida sp.]|nr:glycosyltransferase family 4 protein [Rubritepida sp.]
MRIAILGPFFFPQVDGVEKVMLFHARHLAARGHEVHVVTSRLRYPTGSFPDAPAFEMLDGVRVHRLEVAIANPHWRLRQEYTGNGGVLVRGLGRKLAEIAPDVLHAHQVNAPAWALGAAWHARRHGRPFFYSPHFHPNEAPRGRRALWLVRAMNRLPLRTARTVFHLTRRDIAPFLAEYPEADPARQEVLPNGVEPPPPFAPKPARAGFRLLFVGRVDEHRKGFDLLRAAFAQARAPGWQLEVVGRIAEETRASLTAEFGDAVTVRGLVSEAELDAAYAAADLFVMPSRYEGFGIPYIEAMRHGTPVVGTTAGGIPEVVPEGTGVLVPPDDVPALTAALTALADDPARRAAMGAAGHAWAEGFAWPRVVDRLEAAYRAA